MCGILGVTILNKQGLKKNYKKWLRKLFLLSESRGKEASGFALCTDTQLRYLKSPFPASELVKSHVFNKEIDQLLSVNNEYYTTIGHSRLVTNGYEQYNYNNQPVFKNGYAAVHNGIIVNSNSLWEKHPDQHRSSELDSELVPTLLNKFYTASGNLQLALQQLYNDIFGMTTIAVLPVHLNNLILATNNGSLYYLTDKDKSAFLFASERTILESFIEGNNSNLFSKKAIHHLSANTACVVQLNNAKFQVHPISKNNNDFCNVTERKHPLNAFEIIEKVSSKRIYVNRSMEHSTSITPRDLEEEVVCRQRAIASLKRCSRCILPETFPFIEFDESGICNYCYNYTPIKLLGIDALKKRLSESCGSNSSLNCLMPFSGGRDSSYALHFVKKVLGMTPLAFSYDWGMLTDLSRRNQARMCGELGVEHLLVSADIRRNRENIRKNVLAWLKRPRLGTVPLFMAGDKKFLHIINRLMKQYNLSLSILGENPLETTRFKTGFCGVKPNFNNTFTYSLKLGDKIKMVSYYGKEYLMNPAFINKSLLDTLDAFKSYYVITHNNINLYDYIPWSEEIIENTLITEYDWETDSGTKSTWRIGDGTAAFYNYIYFMVAGFSENDTFRSNQIREGLITREQGLNKVISENLPRFDSIQWYCNTIGIEWKDTLQKINRIPALFA